MRQLLVISAAAMLASCGGADEGSFTTEDGGEAAYDLNDDEGGSTMTFSDGEGGEMTMRTGDELAVDLPDGFSLPDGANVTTSANMAEGDGVGQMVAFTAEGSADEILANLREQAENAGFEINTTINSQGLQMIAGDNEDGGNFSAHVMEGGEDGQLSGTLTFAQGM